MFRYTGQDLIHSQTPCDFRDGPQLPGAAVLARGLCWPPVSAGGGVFLSPPSSIPLPLNLYKQEAASVLGRPK